jgi:hypothetical protein
MPTGSVLRAAVLVCLLLTAAGCGSSTVSPSAASPSAASPSSASPPSGASLASPTPASPSPVTSSPTGTAATGIIPGGPPVPPITTGRCHDRTGSRPGSVLTLRNGSDAGTYCVSIGQRVVVYLAGTPSRMWAPIRSDSRALVPVGYGHLSLPVGVTGASFAAVHDGVVHLGSSRPVCASGPVHCNALIAFQVTIKVGGIQASPVH